MKMRFPKQLNYLLAGSAILVAPGLSHGQVSQSLMSELKPAVVSISDGANINYELGMNFSASTAGVLSAIRFYKSPGESNRHNGKVYSSSGQVLASVTFLSESTSGWQQANLSTPLAIKANTPYVVSVNTSRTLYVDTVGGFDAPILSGALKATAGVYGPIGAIPTHTWKNSNYFRDIVFFPDSVVPTPTPAPTAVPTPHPTATPTPMPSPVTSGGCPAYPAFPDANCTGWRHTGVVLTAVPGQLTSGPGWHVDTVAGQQIFYVTQDGAVVDGLDISIPVKVFANNVIIQRSRIRADDYYIVRVSDPPANYYTGLTMIDVELDGENDGAATAIAVEASEGAHFVRLDVHGMGGSGPRLTSNNLIEDSYIHDFACAPQIHTAGMSANNGGKNITVLHNNIEDDQRLGCASAAWEIAQDFGTYDGVLTEKNLFNGGAYCAYAGINVAQSNYAPSINIQFIDNVFGRKFSAECGGYGPIAQWGAGTGNVWSNNTWGPGAFATSSHQTGDMVNP